MDAGLIIVLIAVGLSQGWFPSRSKKWVQACGWTGLILLITLASPLSSMLIRTPLLRAAEGLVAHGRGCPDHPGPVVVLGGGATPDGVPGAETLERLVAAANWLKKNHSAQSQEVTVVVTGGPANLNIPGSLTESDAMANMLDKLIDIPQGVRILKESASLNTHDNAIFTRKTLADKGGPVVLVTSQVHMPRAAAVFTRAGFNVCAVHAPEAISPLGFVTESGWLNFGTARRSITTLNEYAGMLAYRLKGWL